MAQILTLSGSSKASRREVSDECKCVYNPRTKKSVLLCTVPKSESRSGKAFKKDLHGLCRR